MIAIIVNGVVVGIDLVHTIAFVKGFNIDKTVVETDSAKIGDTYDGKTFTPHVPSVQAIKESEQLEALRSLSATDAKMARAAEDVIQLLIAKGIVQPEEIANAMSLVGIRSELRSKLK